MSFAAAPSSLTQASCWRIMRPTGVVRTRPTGPARPGRSAPPLPDARPARRHLGPRLLPADDRHLRRDLHLAPVHGIEAQRVLRRLLRTREQLVAIHRVLPGAARRLRSGSEYSGGRRPIMSLRTPICDLFGIEHPVFLAGMGGVAFADVCAAVSEAGGFGTLGLVGFPPERIRKEMRGVRARTNKPFGVDLLAALPENIHTSIDVIVEEGAAAFVAGLGVPEPVIEKCHRGGVKVMAVCGKVSHAVHAEAAGCDAVVAQGTEAGGHTGQVAAMALVPQTVDAVKIPVLAAGSIVDGRGLAAALALGAQRS